jgi:pyridoxamine 5'-phosphate oxidase
MTDLYTEALSTFAALFEEAKRSAEIEPNAMTVATADTSGQPSARTVLLDSHKGRELRSNPRAALLFLWRSLREAGIQVRIEGHVEQVDDAEADAYFASRPRMSQIGAWASLQSKTLASREEFDARVATTEASFADREVPRPEGWSGLRVVPQRIEFWYGAQFRLHERWCYEVDHDGQWSKRLLFP